MAVNYWKIVLIGAASSMVMGLAGCGKSEHGAVLALAKCMKAANYLEDSRLSAAARHRAETAWKEMPGSAKYAMEVGQELRDEAEPHGSSTNPMHVLSVAREWKNSDYCEQVEVDFSQFIDKEASRLSQPVVDKNADPASCPKYVEQFDIYSNRHAVKHREEMAKVINASLAGSLGLLKSFQLEAAKGLLEGPDARKFSYEVYEQCKAGGALSEQLAQTKFIQELRSPVTKQISAFIDSENAIKGDCGEFPNDYCKAELMLQAAYAALAKSEQCDRDIKALSCPATAAELIDQDFRPLEQAKLLGMQEKYRNFIATPEKYDGNTYANIERLANPCKHAAVDRGIYDAAYTSYVNSTCLPRARAEFLKPTLELLARIESRLTN